MLSLLFLESIGTTELLVILIAALVLFGPRKLPELSRSLGKSLGEFKRASDEFKKTWEREVDLERTEKEARVERAMLPPEERPAQLEVAATEPTTSVAPTTIDAAPQLVPESASVARGSQIETATNDASPAPARKSEWL